MLTGNVLTASYLLNIKEPDATTADSLTLALSTLQSHEWQTLKHFIETGTFIGE